MFCLILATDRLEATKKEVAVLHSRFEAELARQSAKAAEMTERAMDDGDGGRVDASATDRDRKEKRTDPPKGRKKKAHHYARGARIRAAPALTPEQMVLASQNSLGPPPIRFLMAELRGSIMGAPVPATQLPPQLEEWICPFCEYDLFYGQESSFRRAVRSRKKVLSRRRRAKERAAAAASGAPASVAPVGEGAPVVDSVTGSSPVKTVPAATTRRERDKSRSSGAVGDT